MGRPGKKKGKVKKMKKSPFAVKSGGNRKKRRKKGVSTDAEAMIVDEMLSTMKQRGAGGEGRLEATEREKATEKPSQLPSQTLEEALNETVTQLATVHVL